jgi:hypothetical protein
MSRTSFTFLRRPFARELLIFIGFCGLTMIMTWPWILHLRDAVADKGDPYMIAWTLWWDFHQTFHNPLHLFDANVFYPYRYTLAFSENDYGIAMLFFPLFALGLKPLTVNAIATFFGFVFSGYGCFRLTRTLTGDAKAAWLAGIIFAFIPYRFHVLSHLHYLFAGWLPTVCEALILFARQTTWKRATWLGVAFLMNALSCVSWFIMALVPLGLTLSFLLFVNKDLVRSRAFWLRGTAAMTGALLLFSPFLITYYRVSVLYGLHWQPWEFAYNSALPIHWLRSDSRNKLWHNLGAWMTRGQMLFPGLLAPLFALAALRLRQEDPPIAEMKRYLIRALDVAIVLAAIIAVLGLGYDDLIIRVFGMRIIRLNQRSATHALVVIIVAAIIRLAIYLPSIVNRIRESWSLTKEINRLRGQPAIAIGLIWTVWGFLASLGPNFFLYRWLLKYVVLFQSIRFPSRHAMICYVGLAVLGGIGGAHIASRLQHRFRFKQLQALTLIVIAGMIMFELRAAPLHIEKGEVEPSALALRLKNTPMKGGFVELPSVADQARHFYMLRAADHQRPLVNATSSFLSPLTDQINKATEGKIDPKFMDLLEQIPASYLVIHNSRLRVDEHASYERFLARHVISGRLRFVNRFDGEADLYAVLRNEPGATAEAPLPFTTAFREWRSEIDRDPVNLLAQPDSAQALYRVMLAISGTMPRYSEFMRDMEIVAALVDLNSEEASTEAEQNLNQFAAQLMQHESFQQLDNRSFVNRLVHNTNVPFQDWEQDSLVQALDSGGQTRVEVQLKIANDNRFIEMQKDRSLLLLHYFAYLRRNPNDPPDRNLTGFNFWLQDLSEHHDAGKIATAFQNSAEFQAIRQRQQ